MSTPQKTKSEAFKFEDFSDEIILKVVSYLNSKDRLKCSFTSNRLRAICQDHTLPSLWQKIHLYNPNLLLETSKNPMATFGKYLLTEMNIEKHLQSTTWKHFKWPCENGLQNCGKMNNNLKQSNVTRNYLNLNIENFNDESISEILDKGCNYLIISDISPRVGFEMISKIFMEKKFLELKEIKFTWSILDETGDESNQHFHYGSKVLFSPLDFPAYGICHKHTWEEFASEKNYIF